MEYVSDVRSKQRAVMEGFFAGVGAEMESNTNIHKRVTNVFGDMPVIKSTVSRWSM
jgi:hypothetical protein